MVDVDVGQKKGLDPFQREPSCRVVEVPTTSNDSRRDQARERWWIALLRRVSMVVPVETDEFHAGGFVGMAGGPPSGVMTRLEPEQRAPSSTGSVTGNPEVTIEGRASEI